MLKSLRGTAGLVGVMALGLGLSWTDLGAATRSPLERGFVSPPDDCRPWVYWFWLNGNLSAEGITADLTAMKAAGIGGVLIMEVDQGAPQGPVPFMSPRWRELFRHVVTEARRLGLEVNLNNDAGWNGSGGPWVKPQQSMQKVVWSELQLQGGKRFEGSLPQPQTVSGTYRDVALLAFPTPGDFRIDPIRAKAAYERGAIAPASQTDLPAEMRIDPNRIVNLSDSMDRQGHLTWEVPSGAWTVMRIGHTSTGVMNAPAPESGRGLECDKLSPAGIEAHFAGMVGPLIGDVGGAAGRTWVATHIDSWENGSQNWTPEMRSEFQKRRGYDPLPFLPTLSGRVVGTLEVSERFLWDLRQTVSDLVIENYAGHLASLVHDHGLRLSIEAYGGPCDDLTYAGRADEPMAEFWIGGGAFETCKAMASAGHIYGRKIIGAEAFTADDHERWLQHPGTLKGLGDRAFCEGINRFVFHRYALSPWVTLRPGMAMGPWGLHYERGQTWWEFSAPWHEYLSRCQFMLRQGLFVADLCSLEPEDSPKGASGHARKGYDYDQCTAEVALNRMSVQAGNIVLPDGMTYRLLVLPPSPTLTPRLLQKIRDLVEAGATVLGQRPLRSPSLTDYPQCDEDVRRLAGNLWGDCDGVTIKEHAYGKGRILTGLTAEEALATMGVGPDFTAAPFVRWIHRRLADTDAYFVASSNPQPSDVVCTFRTSQARPEFWQPETGRIEPVAVYEQSAGVTRMPIHLPASGSVFVVFRPGKGSVDPVAEVSHNGQAVLPAPSRKVTLVIQKAVYGVLDDPARTRDVRAKLQALVDRGELSFQVARMAEGDDPAFGVVKTLIAEYTADGIPFTVRGQDPEEVTLTTSTGSQYAIDIHRAEGGRLWVDAWEPGRYEIRTASGQIRRCEVRDLAGPFEVTGPWQLRFPPGTGVLEHVTLDKLISWSDHADPGVRTFSGTATYAKCLQVPRSMVGHNRHLVLDLGNVQVMARVRLNGKDLGILWKPPYCVEITDAVKVGPNQLEVDVVNLWVNRMIGDESLPEDSPRNPNGTLKEWPQWVREGKPSPTGRTTFTTWRLWKAGDTFVPSGLIGPVTLRSMERIPAR